MTGLISTEWACYRRSESHRSNSTHISAGGDGRRDREHPEQDCPALWVPPEATLYQGWCRDYRPEAGAARDCDRA